MYDAVLFDMDGVVVDTAGSVSDFWHQLASSHGITLSAENMRRHVFGRTADHTLRTLFPGIPADVYAQIYGMLRAYELELTYSAVPGVTSLLHELHDRGIPTALVTGAKSWKVKEVLQQLALTEAFGACVIADDVAAGKPDPRCYLLAAERLRVPARRCIVFEDAPSGITAAVEAGACCVAIASEHDAPELLAHGAVSARPDFRGISVEDDGAHGAPRLSLGQGVSFAMAS
jgi:HAD superfamily hydrolase (TIGR01509 family)